jgi:hypothetical protein
VQQHHANSHIDNGGCPSLEATPFFAQQEPMVVQHFKCATQSIMSVTRNVAHFAKTAIQDEASTRRNKWMTPDACGWKTAMCHCHDSDDEMGFNVNTLTRAVKLFGTKADSKVRGGNSTGVHLCLQFFVRHDKNGKKSEKSHKLAAD